LLMKVIASMLMAAVWAEWWFQGGIVVEIS
jgi:hypothetical protein